MLNKILLNLLAFFFFNYLHRGGYVLDGEQYNSKGYVRILMSFSGNVDNGPSNRKVNFGDVPAEDFDL